MCGCEASGGTRPPLPGGSPAPKGTSLRPPGKWSSDSAGGVLYYMFESGVTEALKLAAATPLDGLPHAFDLLRKEPPAGRSTIRRFRCWALTCRSDIHATSARTHSTRPEAVSALHLSRTKARAWMADDAPQRSATPMLRGMWQAAITPRTPRRAKWCRLGLRMRTGQHRSVPLTQSVPTKL
jgi:hypothetical protein